MIQMNTQPSP